MQTRNVHGQGRSEVPARQDLSRYVRQAASAQEEAGEEQQQQVSAPARCAWARSDLGIPYHDTEWGVPVHDDRTLFEFLILEVESAVTNARAFLAAQREAGSFAAYVWTFVGGAPRVNRRRSLAQLPPRTAESDALSRDLKARGFRFVGSTICYAFMQAVGMVNDHTIDCFRYRELAG